MGDDGDDVVGQIEAEVTEAQAEADDAADEEAADDEGTTTTTANPFKARFLKSTSPSAAADALDGLDKVYAEVVTLLNAMWDLSNNLESRIRDEPLPQVTRTGRARKTRLPPLPQTISAGTI